MATIFSDDFNRADSGDPGSSYQEMVDRWSIVSNQLVGAANGGSLSELRTNGATAVADCKVSVTRRAGAGFDGGVAVRCSGTAGSPTLYFLDFYGTNTVEVYRRVAGAEALIGGTTSTHANGDTYALEVSGTGSTVTLKVWRNGALLTTLTDSSASRITTAGQYSVIEFANSTFDSFLVEDLGGSTTYQRQFSITSTASADTSRKVSKGLTVSSTGTPSRALSISKGFTSAIAGAAAASKRIGKGANASSTASAAMSQSAVLGVSSTVSGTGTVTVSSTAVLGMAFTVAAAGAVSLSKRIGKEFASTASAILGAPKRIAKGIAAAASATVSGFRSIKKVCTSSSTASVAFGDALVLDVTSTVTATGTPSLLTQFMEGGGEVLTVVRAALRNVLRAVVRPVIRYIQ